MRGLIPHPVLRRQREISASPASSACVSSLPTARQQRSFARSMWSRETGPRKRRVCFARSLSRRSRRSSCSAAPLTPTPVGEAEGYTSVSLGIAVHSEADDHPQHLLRSADLALYRAKEQGRARFQVFDPRMHEEAVRRLRLETDLRRALERNQFRLHYQPVVSLDTGRIVAVEALLRWEHPERGLVPPGEFIHVAEETGLITEISRWVLEQACRQCQMWRREHGDDAPETVWVNMSIHQLIEGGLARQTADVLHAPRSDTTPLPTE